MCSILIGIKYSSKLYSHKDLRATVHLLEQVPGKGEGENMVK